MEHDALSSLPEPPEGFRWHDTARFGFAVAVPRRFHLLANTVDPVARMWRHSDDPPDDAANSESEPGGDRSESEPGGGGPSEATRGRWPDGLWDPEVIGELPGGRVQPFRLFEFDAIGGRDYRLPPDAASRLWFEARQMFTATLEAAELPGYRLLDIHDMQLGRLDALGFEYRWDGLRLGEDGGDHALLVWGLSSWVAFHVYHHCPEDEWATYLPELETVLGTFRALAPDPPLDFSPSTEPPTD